MHFYAGRGANKTFETLSSARPTSHQLDGNVSRSGPSSSALRKAASSNQRGSGQLTPLAQLQQLAEELRQQDRAAWLKRGGDGKRTCYGFVQHLHVLADQYVAGLWTDYEIDTWVTLCGAGAQGGLWFDATGGQVGRARCCLHFHLSRWLQNCSACSASKAALTRS